VGEGVRAGQGTVELSPAMGGDDDARGIGLDTAQRLVAAQHALDHHRQAADLRQAGDHVRRHGGVLLRRLPAHRPGDQVAGEVDQVLVVGDVDPHAADPVLRPT
jgi:hypothetical protein